MIAGVSSAGLSGPAVPNCDAMPSSCISCTSTTTLWHSSFANASLVSAVGVLLRRESPGETRENVLRIRLTEAEREALDEAASSRALDTSSWARSQLLAIARKVATREPDDS